MCAAERGSQFVVRSLQLSGFPFNWRFSPCKTTIKELTMVGRGWAKFRDLSVASRSIICWSRRLRQIFQLRDTDKSLYFAITEFNNCFIIQSPSLFFKIYLREDAILTQERSQEGEKRGFFYAWAEYFIKSRLSLIFQVKAVLNRTVVVDIWVYCNN